MSDLKKTVLYVLKYLLILVFSAGLGFALLVIAYKIPVDPASKEASLRHLNELGFDPLVNDRYEQYISHFDSFEPGVLNDNTDRIILLYSYGDPEVSAVHQAAYMYSYGRYWHGYVVILRILFRFINYFDLPLLNGMLQISLAMLLAILIYKKTGKIRYSLAVLSSYLLLMPIALAYSLQFTDVFYLSFTASVLLVAFPKLGKRKNLYLFFFVFGILTAYFDFFTYHLLVWAYPFCWYLVIRGDERDYTLKDRIQDVICSALIWTAGYAGMYASKFLILYLVCGYEALIEGFVTKGFVLMSGSFEEYMVDKQTYSRLGVIYTNWRHYMYKGYEILISCWCIYALIGIFRNRFNISKNSIPFLIITLSSPAWFFVFYLHTAIHHSFAYRNFAASILAFILIICGSVYDKDKNLHKKSLIIRCSVLFTILIVGWILSGISKENILHMFGGENDEHLITAGDTLEFTFVPDHKIIRRIGLCAHPAGDLEGTIKLSFTDGSITYTSELPIADFADYALQTEDVNWSFDTKKKYTVDITVENNTDGAYILLTKEGNMPLAEYSNGSLNGNPVGNVEPLAFIIYNADSKSKIDKCFIALVISIYTQIIVELFIDHAFKYKSKTK